MRDGRKLQFAARAKASARHRSPRSLLLTPPFPSHRFPLIYTCFPCSNDCIDLSLSSLPVGQATTEQALHPAWSRGTGPARQSCLCFSQHPNARRTQRSHCLATHSTLLLSDKHPMESIIRVPACLNERRRRKQQMEQAQRKLREEAGEVEEKIITNMCRCRQRRQWRKGCVSYLASLGCGMHGFSVVEEMINQTSLQPL